MRKSHFRGILAVRTWNVTTSSALFSQIRCIFMFIHVLEGVFFVKDFLKTSSKIDFKHFPVTWMWSITWRRWSFRSPHLNVGQFSNTSFLKPIVTSGKLKELISPHCLQIKYLYFTCNCFHLWLLAITEGKTWEQRSLLLHRETECKQLQMHERRNWHLPQWNCGKKLAKDWRILPGSLKAQFNLFIDSFTKTKYRLHRRNNYIFFFYQKGKRNLGGNEWYYRR